MRALTAYQSPPQIYPIDNAMWHRGIFGVDTAVIDDPSTEGFETQIISNNEIRIRSGIGMIQGRFFDVRPNTYDTVNIQNGTQGQSRIDLIVCRYTHDNDTQQDDTAWVVIQGTPAESDPVAPAYTEGDLNAGDTVADMPMFQVLINGITLESVTPVFDLAPISRKTRQMFADAGYPITEETS